jgi:hypothetical protein
VPDPRGQDWLVLRNPASGWQVAFQQVPELPEATWPDGPHPQMLHLDLTVPTAAALEAAHTRALDPTTGPPSPRIRCSLVIPVDVDVAAREVDNVGTHPGEEPAGGRAAAEARGQQQAADQHIAIPVERTNGPTQGPGSSGPPHIR